jgi:hypothetical protein
MAFTIINGTAHRVEVDVVEETRSVLGSYSKRTSFISPARVELVYSKYSDSTCQFGECHIASPTGAN